MQIHPIDKKIFSSSRLFRSEKIITIVILFMTMSFMHVSASVQSQKVSISGENMTVEEVFKAIEKQTDLSFFYRSNEVKEIRSITLNLNNVDFKEVLERVFMNTDFEYVLDNNTIIVNKKPVVNKEPKNNVPVNQEQTQVKSKTVKGKVVDEYGEPLIGATILIKGKDIWTTTDLNGDFTLNKIESTDIILFSYIGFESQELAVGGQTSITVTLKSMSERLEGVVVTGYQIIDKRTFTGSVAKVEAKDLATGVTSDIGKALQGMVAGVSVESTSGTFGTKSKIRIRGTSSISGNQEPLWVIDGVVLDDPVNVNPNQLFSGDASTLLSSAISGINPDDIEDVQILKDASATAMYGTQAVNGVIVVTTKKGKAGKTSVSYKTNLTLSMKPNIQNFNVMNSKERMEFSEELYQKNIVDFTNLNSTYGAYGKLLFQLSRKQLTWNGFYDEVQRAKTYNTDWFDALFKNSLTQEHSASISTGTEKSQFYMSVSYFNDGGVTRNQSTDRFSANFKGNFKLSNSFTLTGILYGSVRNQRSFGVMDETLSNGVSTREYDINPYTYALNTSRAMRPYNDQGELEYYQSNYAPFNILHEMDNNFVDIKLKEVRFQLEGLWKIRDNLNFATIVSGRSTSASSEHISTELSNVAESYRSMQSTAIRSANGRLYNDPYDDSEFPISVLPRGGIAVVDNNLGEFYTFRNTLNYKPKIGEHHSFDLMAGSELKQKKYNSYNFKAYGLEYNRGMTSSPDYRAIQRDILSATGSPYYRMGVNTYREASFFANLAYTYRHKYNFTFSTRADGSNRLGASERFRFLPIWVLGASWNIDDEPFLRNIEWLDFMKIRGSYGTRGNISGLGSPELLAYYQTTSRFNPNEIENVISITAPDNPTMQWEKEKMANAAIEFGLFSRLSATLEWYHRSNYDLIGNIQVSRVSGFTSKTMNWADMTNQGFEATLNIRNINKENFKWSSVITFGYNKNEVKRLENTNTVLRQTVDRGAPMVGKPATGLYSFKFATLDEDGLPLFYDSNGNMTNKFTKYSRNLDMLVYEGSREPLGSGGFTNQFTYKNLNLSFLFTYSFGNKLRLNPFFSRYYSDIDALSADLANRWTAPGDERYTNVPRIIDKDTRSELLQANADPFTAYNRSDIRVVDGSFIRFRNFMLSYNFPKRIINHLGLQSLKLTAQANNILLWADKNLKGQDPEAIVTGVSMPPMTSYTFGLDINF